MSSKLSTFVRNNYLLFFVFFTGAAVLILEIAATRVLSSYFGNTIYTVTSVISVILLALSVGYYAGGRIADKKGSLFLFFQLISLSGLSVFLLQLLNIYLLPYISQAFSLREGPIIASLALFLFPSIFLGMLSPLVAKLQNLRLKKQGIGQITGDVFFWSTLGSIVGSISAGFYLIPTFGLDQIIIGVGIALFIVGILGMGATKSSSITGPKILIFFLLLPFIHGAFVILGQTDSSRIVHRQDGVYDNIIIYDGIFHGKQSRFLRQATDASSAMYLHSADLVYDYTKYYEVYKFSNPDISRALVIGGGAYSVPKAILYQDKDVIVDVAEIEPELYPLGQKYFQVPKTARLQNHVEDGRRVLKDADTQYDLIFNDAFHFTIPSHLTTKEFFELTKAKLTPDGVFVGNIIGSLSERNPSFLFSEIKTFQSVYPNGYVFAVESVDRTSLQNIMIVGFKSDKKIDFSTNLLQKSFPQPLSTKLVNIADYDLTQHKLFTDNFAPVEFYLSQRFTE